MAGKTWTKEENDIIKEYYPNGGVDSVFEKIITRTRPAIIEQANRLRIRSLIFYTQDDINYLKKEYPQGKKENIENKLGRSWTNIKAFAFRVGLKRDVSFLLKKTNKKQNKNRSRVYIKNQLINERGQICEFIDCNWVQTLEIHHIDGDTNNNDYKNLKLLCPNHHSITQNHAHQGNNGWKK